MGLRHLVIVSQHNKVRLLLKSPAPREASMTLLDCACADTLSRKVVGIVTRKDLANLRSHHQKEDFMGSRVDEVTYFMPENFSH